MQNVTILPRFEDGRELCPGQRLGITDKFGEAEIWDVLQTILDGIENIQLEKASA